MSSFELAIESYLEELRVARRCSPHTVSNYARDLRSIAGSAINRELSDWDHNTVMESLVAAWQDGYQPLEGCITT